MSVQSPILKISIEKEILQDRNIAVIRLQGVVDASNSQYLQQSLINTIDESDTRYLIFELSKLERIASSGIGGLMAVARKIEEKQGEIVLTGLHAAILTIFNLLGFTTFYKTATDVDHARSLLQPAGEVSPKDVEPGKFPLVVACPQCSRKLRVPRPGKFKCGVCGFIIGVDASGYPGLGA